MKNIIIILFLLFSNVAYADIVIHKTDGSVFIGDRIEYYEDENNLNFNDILKLKTGWKTSPDKSIGLGYKKSVLWMKFDLENRTDRELFLTFNVINNDTINVYLLNDDGNYIEKTGGSIYPFSHREVYNKDIFFTLPKHHGVSTVYARLMSNYVLETIPEIVTSTKMAERGVGTNLSLAFYHGILAALLIYHLFILFSSRELNYLVLVFLIASFSLYDLAHDGLGFMFLWPESVYFENIVIPLSVALMHITSVLFIQLSAGTRRNFRNVYWLLNASIVFGFTHLILIFFCEKYTNIGITITYALYASLVSLVCLFYMGVIRRNRSAFILFLGYVLFELGNIIAIATTNAALIKSMPFLTDYSLVLLIMKFTKVWFLVLFSFTVVDKINIMRKELKISEETYKAIFNGTTEALVILDNESYTLVDCNQRLLDMLNVEYENIIGRTPGMIGAVENGFVRDKLIEYIEKMKADGSVMFEWCFNHPNGEKQWVEIVFSNVTLNGTRRILGVIRDINDRKRNEAERKQLMEQLMQSQKMEAVGSLAGGLAHDFNNILTGIMGSSSMLEMHIREKEINKPKIEKYIAIINESSQKAAAIVRRLLTLTRKSELTFKPVDLNQSLKNVIDICLNSFPKSITIQEKYYDKPAVVKADAAGLEQVLLNILVNASHALTIMNPSIASQGGEIAVKVDKQLADETFCKANPAAVENTNYFSISIQDNGCGMNRSIQDKIFDPFFTTKSKQEGTGLGLSMVFSTVKLHNGIVKVYSEERIGTTFIVYIPENPDSKVSAHKDGNTVMKWHGRILVIDDENSIRTIAEDILADSGYEVLTAPDGIKGIDIFSRNIGHIDAILLDTSMPGISGLETYKRLREIDPSVKIIMSSGFGMDKRVQEALNRGADSFIQKPYTNIQLSNFIYNVIANG